VTLTLVFLEVNILVHWPASLAPKELPMRSKNSSKRIISSKGSHGFLIWKLLNYMKCVDPTILDAVRYVDFVTVISDRWRLCHIYSKSRD
jgi:hypothetical protein